MRGQSTHVASDRLVVQERQHALCHLGGHVGNGAALEAKQAVAPPLLSEAKVPNLQSEKE
jgi:hypothetical protein